jgi:hypothetical protein
MSSLGEVTMEGFHRLWAKNPIQRPGVKSSFLQLLLDVPYLCLGIVLLLWIDSRSLNADEPYIAVFSNAIIFTGVPHTPVTTLTLLGMPGVVQGRVRWDVDRRG